VAYPLEESGSADLILLQEAWGHREFFDKIIRAAIKRHKGLHKKWKLILNHDSHYGMYAVEDVAAGEVIEAYEEQPHVLVSKKYVQKTWNEQQLRWFGQYAYPLTDELFVSWSHDPDHWKPINHSCDPSAWLDGLNLVARRDIQPGQEITMDYATFCNERMAEFICSCGGDQCRGVVRGTDHKEPFMERYGDHVSDYVRTRQLLTLAPVE
jgi:D-alanine-D-alanine ligase